MTTIIFEAHSTTFDNEAHLSSGWNDVALSPLGITQSHELGARYAADRFDAIYCSDLQRGVDTAQLTLGTAPPPLTISAAGPSGPPRLKRTIATRRAADM